MLRSLRRRLTRPAVVLVAFTLALPAGASAAGDPGLHVDPASPVAKAYALPLDGVRTAASGGSHGPELFGAGIKRGARPAAYRIPEPGASSGLAWMAIVAVVVVAAGSAGALVQRRRR